MRVLALDTTTRAGSVAIVDDSGVVYAAAGDAARSHAERLPGDLVRALDAASLAIGDIDLFAVASGPGSFTGLRIGIATVQGFAFTQRRPVVAVSALLALGHGALDACTAAGDGLHAEDVSVGAWMDAHRREVFSALFRAGRSRAPHPPGEATRLEEIDAPTVADPTAIWSRWMAAGHRPAVLIGDGAVLYGERFAAADRRIVAAPPLAPIIGRLALEAGRLGQTIAPAAVQPLYVRRPDAEVARDARRKTPA